MTNLSKTAQLLKYFAQQYPGVPRTLLAKYVYLADLHAREYLGEQISDFVYRKDNYGPFDRSYYSYIEELEAAGVAQDVFEHLGGNYRTYRLYSRAATEFDFSAEELDVLAYVCRSYLGMSKPELLEEVVYQTKPMVPRPAEGEALDMDSINNEGRNEVGFDLSEILLAERQIASGNYTTNPFPEPHSAVRSRVP